MSARARLAVLISGNGSNLQAILDACAAGTVDAEVVLVLSNRPGAYGLERARRAGVEVDVLDHRDFDGRASFDEALAGRLAQAEPDFIALAGFMRILTPAFVSRFTGRMINIHPSLLPRHPGLDTHARALAAGDAEHGCSVHFVTPEVDGGPVIIQGVMSMPECDDPDILKARVHALEHQVYPQALAWLTAGCLSMDAEGSVRWDGQVVTAPARLDETGRLCPPRTVPPDLA
ncbi:MAG: phosphoribosylglycinamide formyltransferase [Halothiobacillaceae bacterium]